MKTNPKATRHDYAEFDCPMCGVVNTLRWAVNDWYSSSDHREWRIVRCWNCKRWYSRVEIESGVLAGWRLVPAPSPLQKRQAVDVYQEGEA